jgi:hypothetical protein
VGGGAGWQRKVGPTDITPRLRLSISGPEFRSARRKMKALEKALSAELRTMPELVSSSSLAKAAIGLAKRLDAEPGDDAATRLTRELRLVTAELHRRAGAGDVASDVEAFLERISAPEFRNAGD